jgi:exopolysaccharide biosynthesis polyprenyl glycosylphosphotransferase
VGSVAIATAAGAMPAKYGPVDVAILLVTLVMAATGLSAAYGLYSRDEDRADHTTVDDIPPLLHVTVITTWLAAVSLWLMGRQVTVGAMLALFVLTFTLVTFGRAATRVLHSRRGGDPQSTIIVGAGSVGQLVAAKLLRRKVHARQKVHALEPIGFVDDDPPELDPRIAHVPVLGSVDDLPQLIRDVGVERVLVAFSRDSHAHTLRLLRSLKAVDVQVDVVPRLFDAFGPNAEIHTLDGLPLIGSPPARRSRGSLRAKRALDLTASLLGLVVLAPFLALIVLLVKLDSRGPATYSAERVGREGRTFIQLKFRTMKVPFCRGLGYGGADADAAFERLLDENPAMREQFESTHKLDPDPRVTRVGRLLRSTSLDELPQLINVIRGEMSLVGPRPVTTVELGRYAEDIPGLLSVRPGLTGYWQVSGRSAVGYDERVRLDLAYVTGWSLKLDLRILLKTLNVFSDRAGAV